MADYEMDEVCSACGAPAGEPCRPDCTGICCDTGETQEVKALRSEVARLRHALDESNAAMREANERHAKLLTESKSRAETWLHNWQFEAKMRGRCLIALDEAERIAELAMSEGLRAVEEMRDYADHKHWCDALGWSGMVHGRNEKACTCGFAALAAWEKG